MGIRVYGNRFRASVSIAGISTQEYFDTKGEAEDYVYYHKNLQGVVFNNCTKKRSTAMIKDLPVGLGEHATTKVKNGNTYNYLNIRATVCIEGNIKTFSRHFGVNLTRA